MCKYIQSCGRNECCQYCNDRCYCELIQCKEVPDTCDGVNQDELQFKKCMPELARELRFGN